MSEIIASTYEIVKELGSGGGGIVYLANHLRLGKKVVLKADKRKITTSPELLRREVDVLKELSHSYIPQVYDFFMENGKIYTVIDYVEGESFDKLLERGEKFTQPQIIRWAQQLLDALSYLHSPTHGTPPRGFVHSDIKPANLMLTPDNNICLIDFNIALALGEDSVIGCSAGYASPEHYGLDFSTSGETETEESTIAEQQKETITLSGLEENTVTDIEEKTVTISKNKMQMDVFDHNSGRASADVGSFSSTKKIIVPDIRSDIYSVGATLYHLLSGKRPSKNAKEVIALSEKEFSPQIVKIITKAMNPNPDLRYQTADEMLYDFLHLRENDSRLRQQKKNRLIICTLSLLFFSFGVFSAFIGLKRMQTTELWLKLAEYSQKAFSEGNITSAVDYALQALPEKTDIFQPAYVSEVQKALTDALGVYDLSDGYKTYKAFELPSAPLCMSIAPDGKTAACMYAYSLVVFDTTTCEKIVELPIEKSALSEVEYLDKDTILYAGNDGIRAYDFAEDTELWIGKPATAISISEDGKRTAAVYKDESLATVYDTVTGQIVYSVDFQGQHQQVKQNDTFANPNNNLFELNEDGTLLAVSFDNGSLCLYNLRDPVDDTIIFDSGSGFSHFEGGFYDHYFAFSASNFSNSIFAVVDTDTMEQTGGFQDENAFSVQTDKNGIYVQTQNILVKIEPDTGEQTPFVTTSETILHFAISGTNTLAAVKDGIMFFNQDADLISSEKKVSGDFVQFAEGIALIGSMDSGTIRILCYENHSDAEIFRYDDSYDHDETRISADGKTITLFSYDQFRIFSINGNLIADIAVPNADQVYDQQFIRDEDGSRLEITYYDGTVMAYSAEDGSVCYEKHVEAPDRDIVDIFETDLYRIESPLHGSPQVYDIKSGKLLYELSEDAYLTYVTQVNDYIIVQYISASDDYCYGHLLNNQCEVLAELPYLCDIYEERLYFDYPSGDVRGSRIFNIDELIENAQKEKGDI